ncbi:hypothetical protein PUATCC27989T_00058 [Phytobacter ursingii]|nr:hypothetical protein PUATCC27989T_00058 [Phytobacter ursingii]
MSFCIHSPEHQDLSRNTLLMQYVHIVGKEIPLFFPMVVEVINIMESRVLKITPRKRSRKAALLFVLILLPGSGMSKSVLFEIIIRWG